MKDITQWAGEHGTQATHSLHSNAHHLIAPIIGRMRMVEAGYMKLTPEAAAFMADRLYLLLELVDRELS